MIESFVKTRTELLAVADTDEATVVVGRSRFFKKRVENFLSMLFEIDNVTKSL